MGLPGWLSPTTSLFVLRNHKVPPRMAKTAAVRYVEDDNWKMGGGEFVMLTELVVS